MTNFNSLPLASQFALSLISVLDYYGASAWNLRTVTATSAAFFLGMRKTIGHARDVDWDAWVHAIISGVGSLICVYLNIYAATTMTGIVEPLGTIQCNGPLTSLHRIIPAITQGYAICDIINGLKLGPAFLAHGIGTFVIMAIFNELEASPIITPILIMEISTIILAVIRADFWSPTLQLITQASFALSFFLCRIIAAPYFYYDVVKTMYYYQGDCFPRYLVYVTAVFGFLFHCLNAFWFTKLIKKIQRNLGGQEELKAGQINE